MHFRTRSDTETVLHLFERYGETCVERMRGMFSIAIWDCLERRLFLARDRFGIKPLYYVHQADGTLIFGSEIKALLPALGGGPTESSRHCRIIWQTMLPPARKPFRRGHATAARSYPGVGRRLHPSAPLLGPLFCRRYRGSGGGIAAEQALVDEYLERFTEAVRLRLMSDVPLGMFLSGGIDSAAITATMAGMKEPVRTFSVAFAEREANELEYARLVPRLTAPSIVR